MAHLSETILTRGEEGGKQSIKILREMGKFLSGKNASQARVTIKFDGAPAIICGTDPSDGQFFVGTKSVFAKSPKLCKSENDCEIMYDGALSQKLKASYRYLKDAKIKGVLQGDLMFTDDKKNETIKGENLLTFRPNTITYAVNPSTPIGKKIKDAKLGIVLHTKYTGDSLSTMSASFDVKKNDFTSTGETWIQGAEFENIGGAASFSEVERNKYESAVNRAEGSLKKSARIMNKIQSGKKQLAFDTEFLKFFNKYVKEGRDVPSVDKAFNDFYYHMGKEYDKVISKYKTIKSQSKKADAFLADILFIDQNKNDIKMMIACYMNLEYAKNILVNKMKKIQSLRLFVDMGNGDYKVTNDEGYVAIVGREAVKLIDRLEFSKLNFQIPKNW